MVERLICETCGVKTSATLAGECNECARESMTLTDLRAALDTMEGFVQQRRAARLLTARIDGDGCAP